MNASIVKTEQDSVNKEAVRLGADVLSRGGLLIFPTETVYGIGVDAFNADAIASLYQKKRRPYDKPLLMHINGLEMAEGIGELDDKARELIRRFTPGPLTLVVRKKQCVPSIAVSGGETVGLRFPSNGYFIELCREFGSPIAATSANLSGSRSVSDADSLDEVLSVADLVIDGGECELGLESTIVSLVGERPKILRQGSFPREMIEEVLGKCE